MVQISLPSQTQNNASPLAPLILLIDIGPSKITIGHMRENLSSLMYQSFSASSFKTLRDVVEAYFNTQAFQAQEISLQSYNNFPFTVSIAIPEEIEQETLSYPLKIQKKEFIEYFGIQSCSWISRENSIAKSIPYLTDTDFSSLSQENAPFSEPKAPLIYLDFSFNLKGVPLIPLIKDIEKENLSKAFWSPLETTIGSLKMKTGLDPYLSLIRYIQTNFASPEHPFNVGQFFSKGGIERVYTALFYLKDIKSTVLDRLQQTPKVIRKGAPTDLDPAEITSPPHMGLEGIDIQIAPNNPPKKLPYTVGKTPESLSSPLYDFDWAALSTLSASTIVMKSTEYQHIKPSLSLLTQIQSLPSHIPPEILQCSYEALTSWATLLGELLAHLTFMYDALGGVYMHGETLTLIESLLQLLPIQDSFEKEGSFSPMIKQISLKRIIHPIPSFIGLLRFLWEEKEHPNL